MRIDWQPAEPYRLFDAGRPLDDILAELERADVPPAWVILRRADAGGLLYAFLPRELYAFRETTPAPDPRPALAALDLHETGSSPTLEPGQPDTDVASPSVVRQPSALRVVRLDAAGQPAEVGELVDWEGRPSAPFEDFFGQRAAIGADDLPAPPGPPSEPLDVVLSGEAPKKLGVGKKATIDIRLEIAAGATPLPSGQLDVTIDARADVVAILSVDATKVAVEGPFQRRLAPPSAGAPSLDAFVVRGREAGETIVDVRFQQGASELGALSFPLTITASRPRASRQAAQAVARPPSPLDNTYLVMHIVETTVADQLAYTCFVSSEALGLEVAEYQSQTFDSAGIRGYVDGLYQRIETQVLETGDDFQVFDIKLRAISTDMSNQLFSPAFVRAVWDHRDAIGGIKVYTREPHVPWELIRMRHPDTGEVDDRYLCEYGLVRNLGGTTRPRTIGKADWAYLVGEYPNNSQKALGEDARKLASLLPAHGIQPTQIPATAKDLLLALDAGAFDVLHIACHGESDADRIDAARLIVSDRQTISQGVQPVSIDALTVQQTASLGQRGPLVFLNACQSGRQGHGLTRLGGWPAAFLGAGAGAFVGASWSVYEKPATAFAAAFYDALLSGATLGAAATQARAAAKALNDASWLAYVIYGDPNAVLA